MQNQILIVTDDAGDAQALQSALHSARDGPFEIVWLRRLSEALERISSDDVDAILVDLLLPDSHGIETFDQLFSAASHIPILTLSTLDNEELAIEAVRRGAQGYLSKGYFRSYLVPQSLRNIIQRKAVEQRLYIEKTRAEITLNSISDAVIGTDLNGDVDYLNLAAEQMTGWTKPEAYGRSIGEVMPLINAKTREAIRNPLELALAQKAPVSMPPDTIVLLRGGREAFIEDSTSPIRDVNGKAVGAVMVFHDITAAQAMSLKIAHLAQHDVLTNLPNRALLDDRITQAIVHARRHGSSIALLFLDLDKFKHINDSLGHDVGDKLLQSVAERLSACVRASDTVSRFGGDEFVVLVSETSHAEGAALAAEKILEVMAMPHVIDGHELHVTTSIGVSMYPDDGASPDALLKNADTAMYQAKEQGRNNYQFFTHAMNVRAVERQVIESNLRTALKYDQLQLYYQPKVNLESGVITGWEALVRWMHPEWGVILPQRFVHVAEECGLIVPIGRWVLLEACLQAMRWKGAELSTGTVAVNISSVEFRYKGFVQCVRETLQETGLAPADLQLEITESVLMHDVAASTKILRELKEIGVQLAVDDFGTGYSSLSYLLEFPIDVLKIDRSFVKDIAATENNGVIVSTVIGMGSKLNQRVIAEGVETQSQLAFLRLHHCEEGQGYVFSKPLDAERFGELLAKGRIIH